MIVGVVLAVAGCDSDDVAVVSESKAESPPVKVLDGPEHDPSITIEPGSDPLVLPKKAAKRVHKSKTDLKNFRAAYPKSWEKLLPPNAKSARGFQPPRNPENKPRMLIIGDSISLCYTPYVRRGLGDKFAVHRVPHNGASTELGLSSIDAYLEAGPWDLITVNWGLHDLIHNKRQTSQGVTRNHRTNVETYTERLTLMLRKLKATKAKVIWVNTTPVLNSARYEPSDVPVYNRAAKRVTDALSIPVVDFQKSQFRKADIQHQEDGLHFKRETCAEFGSVLSSEILKMSP